MVTFNPKQHAVDTSKSIGYKMLNPPDLVSPIIDEIIDEEQTIKTFNSLPLVPYAGAGGKSFMSLVSFLNSLRYMSPTLGSCINSIKKYAFNGKIDLVKRIDNVFDLGKIEGEVLKESQKIRFLEWYRESFNDVDNIMKLSTDMYDFMRDNGNIFIELTHVETNGVKSSYIKLLRTENVAFVYNTNLTPNKIAHSLRWDYDYIKGTPPRILPVYPNYVQKGSIYKTVIHIKNGNFTWFGRPDWISAWRAAYNEFQNQDYYIKISNSNFTGKILLEFEVSDYENDDPFEFRDTVETQNTELSPLDKIELNFTAKSEDPQTVMVTTRPYGSKPVFVHEFKLHLNESYFKINNEINRQKIIENNHWSEYLLGNNSFGTGWNDAAYLEDLFVKNFGVLEPYRVMVARIWDTINTEIAKFHGKKEFMNVGFKYKPEIGALFDKLDESRKMTTHGISTKEDGTRDNPEKPAEKPVEKPVKKEE